MAMMWMRMPGQTWAGAAVSFLGMWIAMMVVMMTPSLIPMLRRYRQRIRGVRHLAWLTALVVIGYFAVWMVIGAAVYPVGAVLSAVELRVPIMVRVASFGTAVVVLAAGILQFTAWKDRRIACCREAHGGTRSPLNSGHAVAAWRHGWQLGRHCVACCGGLMAASLVVGMTDWRVMTMATVAIAAERVAFARVSVARVIGLAVVGVGMVLLLQGVRETPVASKGGHRRWGDGIVDSVRCRSVSYHEVSRVVGRMGEPYHDVN